MKKTLAIDPLQLGMERKLLKCLVNSKAATITITGKPVLDIWGKKPGEVFDLKK